MFPVDLEILINLSLWSKFMITPSVYTQSQLCVKWLLNSVHILLTCLNWVQTCFKRNYLNMDHIISAIQLSFLQTE